MESLVDKMSARDARTSSEQSISDSARLSAKYMEVTEAIAVLQREQSHWQSRLRELSTGESTGISPTRDINELNKELLSLYVQKESLQNELADLQTQITDLTGKKKKLEESVDFLAETSVHLRSSIATLTAKRSEIENTLDRVRAELSEVSKQLQERTKQVEELRSVVGTYKAKVQESSEYIQTNEKYSAKHAMKTLLTIKDAHAGAIVGVQFGRGYNSIVTIGEDKRVFQWGLPALNEIKMCPLGGLPNAFKVHKELGFASIAGRDRMLRVLNLELGKMIVEHQSHNEECTDVMWLSKNQIVTSSKDRTVKLFDLNSNTVVSTILVMTAVNSLCETNSPEVIAAGCYTGIRLVDKRTGKIEGNIAKVHGNKQITCIIPSTSKDNVYTIGTDGQVCQTDLRAAVKVHQWKHEELVVSNSLTKISIDPMGGYLAAGSENGSVLLFDIHEYEKPPVVMKQHSSAVLSSAFAANMLVTADKEGKLAFWV